MFDRYTKAILTVIAIALSVLAVHNVMPIASAVGASSCGTHWENACYVRLVTPLELKHQK